MTFNLLKLNEYKQEWKSNPNGFMKEMLGAEVPMHQKRWGDLILENDDITIKSSNGIGKSCFFAALALWFLFCYHVNDDDNVIVLITAPTFGQVRENIYNPIRKFIDKIDQKLLTEYNKLSDKLKKQIFPDGPAQVY